MVFADCGTAYTKIYDSGTGMFTTVATVDLPADFRADIATGHNGARFCGKVVNELVVLARGAELLVREPDFTLLDIGARDIKCVRFVGSRFHEADWNVECGASMGFSIELLARYFRLDFSELEVPADHVELTCGILGISDLFDSIAGGMDLKQAVARFVKGVALNAYAFAGSPARLYLSGGLCENPFFLRCLPCDVVPLGRNLLVLGLRSISGNLQEG